MCFTLPYVTAPPIPVIRSNANNKPTNRIEKKNASLSLTTIADKAATPPTKIVIMLRPTSQKNTTFNLHESIIINIRSIAIIQVMAHINPSLLSTLPFLILIHWKIVLTVI